MKKRKKVLHIVEAFGGGVFTVLCDLINGISDEYDVVIAYSLRTQTPKDFKNYFNKNIRFIEVKNFTRSINLKKDIKALKEIKRIIKEEKPDIVHLHSSKAGILGRIAISGRKVKMFYNPHGFAFLKKDDSKLKRIIYWSIEKITAIINHKCTIIGCSNGEYKEALKISKNSVLINNGIQTERLDNELKLLEDKNINLEDLRICTLGRIGYQKSPSMFNNIAEKLPTLKFTWIGEGELRKEIKSQNINITGWKIREQALKFLNENDIFILTSLWEGLPISLLEAMYMKKICIVTNVVGNKDVIKNEINGFVCNNADDFVYVIENIQNGKYDINAIKQNAYNDILNNYNTKVMCNKYLEEYVRKNAK